MIYNFLFIYFICLIFPTQRGQKSTSADECQIKVVRKTSWKLMSDHRKHRRHLNHHHTDVLRIQQQKRGVKFADELFFQDLVCLATESRSGLSDVQM
jgi:hypothetical protein